MGRFGLFGPVSRDRGVDETLKAAVAQDALPAEGGHREPHFARVANDALPFGLAESDFPGPS